MKLTGLSMLEVVSLVDGLSAEEAVDFSKKFSVSVRHRFLDIISNVYIDSDEEKIITKAWEDAIDLYADWVN